MTGVLVVSPGNEWVAPNGIFDDFLELASGLDNVANELRGSLRDGLIHSSWSLILLTVPGGARSRSFWLQPPRQLFAR